MLFIFAPADLVALSVSQQFISALHGPPPLIIVYCGHQALVSQSAMNSMSHKIPWHGSCIWVVRQSCTRTAQTAPMTSGVTNTGQDQERRWTKRISRGLHQDKPCSSPHHRTSILVSMKCYWTLSLHQFRYGCSMMLITARMWLNWI
jgi:hypothetical protein